MTGATTSEGRTDEELLVGSAADPRLFTGLYERHAAALLTFFARRTFDAQVAADLTAETFAAAFASRARYRDRGAGSAAAWLFTLGRRQLSHFVRHSLVERRARERLGMGVLALSLDDIERIEEQIDFERVGRTVAAALGRLKQDQRDALQLRVIDGLSYGEAARALGCSEDVVRARVSRGLRRLAAELGG